MCDRWMRGSGGSSTLERVHGPAVSPGGCERSIQSTSSTGTIEPRIAPAAAADSRRHRAAPALVACPPRLPRSLPMARLNASAKRSFRDRLEQIVDGRHLERPDRILVVRGDEDHRRHALCSNSVDDPEAVGPRHLHVEEHQVRLLLADEGDRLPSVSRFPTRPRGAVACTIWCNMTAPIACSRSGRGQLGGDDAVVGPAAAVSAAGFALNAGLLKYLGRIERTRRLGE